MRKLNYSFVLLPLSPPISGAEVGKIIAVFRESIFAYQTRFLTFRSYWLLRYGGRHGMASQGPATRYGLIQTCHD